MNNGTVKKRHKKTVNEKVFIIVLLIVPIANFLVFWCYTSFSSILLAFQKWDSVQQRDVFSLVNFEFFFKEFTYRDSELFIAIKNTLIYFFANIIIVFPLSLFFCYFLYKRIAGYKFFRVVFYLPSIISATVMVTLFKYVIQNGGIVDQLMIGLRGESFPFLTDSKYATATIVVYTIYTTLCSNLIYFSGAMSNIDESIVEAGKIDGTNIWTEMTRIVIPIIWPTISTLLLFAFVGIFGSSGPILLFTNGNYKTTTFSFWIYKLVYYSRDYYYASAIGLVITAVAAPIALLLKKYLVRSYTE